MAKNDLVNELLSSFELLKDEYEELKEENPEIPRINFRISDMNKQNPSACAQAILSRLAIPAGITTEGKDISALARDLISFWRQKNAPEKAKLFKRDFRAHVTDLIRQAKEVDAAYRKELKALSKEADVKGSYIHKVNGKFLIDEERILKTFKPLLDQLYSPRSSPSTGKIVPVLIQAAENIVDQSMSEFNVIKSKLPLTDIFVSLTKEAVKHISQPDRSGFISAVDVAARDVFEKAGYSSPEFRSSFNDILNVPQDAAYALARRAFTGGGAKK